jgi:hypothetical protein
MQTGEWMAYYCSLCFSDQFSYKTLCISMHGFKDMNFARFKHFLQKQNGKVRAGLDLHCPGPIWPAAGDR